jgi:hypothetical protein
MKVFVAISVSLIPPTVEVFTDKAKADGFAFTYKRNTGHTLVVTSRDIIEDATASEASNGQN